MRGADLLKRPRDGKVRCLACGEWIDLRVWTSIADHPECGCFFLMNSALLNCSMSVGGLTFSEEEFVGWWVSKETGKLERTP